MLADKPTIRKAAPSAKRNDEEAVPPGPPLDLYVSGVVLPWTDEKKMIEEARELVDE